MDVRGCNDSEASTTSSGAGAVGRLRFNRVRRCAPVVQGNVDTHGIHDHLPKSVSNFLSDNKLPARAYTTAAAKAGGVDY